MKMQINMENAFRPNGEATQNQGSQGDIHENQIQGAFYFQDYIVIHWIFSEKYII